MQPKGFRYRCACFVMVALLAAWTAVASAQSHREPYRDPNAAAVKSLVVPGWGQHGNLEASKGWLFTLNAMVALLFATSTLEFSEGNSARLVRGVAVADYVLNAGFSAYDAYVNAERLNRENGYLLGEPDVGRADAARPHAGVAIALVRLGF